MKKFTMALCFGLVFTILISMAKFDASCEQLRQNVLRLHIIANSDSSEDQALKLKVRDRILEAGKGYFGADMTVEGAIETAKKAVPLLQREAERVIAENGYDYDVKVSIGPAHFGTREYEDFTLPAGDYEAVRVVIGNGSGKNWWCVMFPLMCVPAAGEHDLREAVDDDAAEISENADGYKIRFKVVEWYEDIKNFLFH